MMFLLDYCTMEFLWDFHGGSLESLHELNGCVWDFQWIPMDLYRVSILVPWHFIGVRMGFA